MWRGFGAGMESHTQRSRAGLEPGVLGDVCGHPLPHSQPSAGPTAVEQWGTPGEVRDGPQGPSQCRAQAEPSAKPGMLDSPCLSEAPTGWAAFGSQERAVWVRMLENDVWAAASTMCCWGRAGAGTGSTGTRAEEWAGALLLGKANSTQYRRDPGIFSPHRAVCSRACGTLWCLFCP